MSKQLKQKDITSFFNVGTNKKTTTGSTPPSATKAADKKEDVAQGTKKTPPLVSDKDKKDKRKSSTTSSVRKSDEKSKNSKKEEARKSTVIVSSDSEDDVIEIPKKVAPSGKDKGKNSNTAYPTKSDSRKRKSTRVIISSDSEEEAPRKSKTKRDDPKPAEPSKKAKASPKIGDKTSAKDDVKAEKASTSKMAKPNSSKRPRAEAADGDTSSDHHSPAKKAPKVDDKPIQTPEEKKRTQASNYFKYLSRGGPKNLGSKTVPVGAPNCLENLTFVTTGVLDSFERDDIVSIVQKYGGRVTTAVSKKTSYLLVGNEPGDSKIQKAKSLKIPTLTEDQFLELIRKSNPNQPTTAEPEFFGEAANESEEDIATKARPKKPEPTASTTPTRSYSKKPSRGNAPHPLSFDQSDSEDDYIEVPVVKNRDAANKSFSPAKTSKTIQSSEKRPNHTDVQGKRGDAAPTSSEAPKGNESSSVKPPPPKLAKSDLSPIVPKQPVGEKYVKGIKPNLQSIPSSTKSASTSSSTSSNSGTTPHVMWVDKYKPILLKNVVGQQGEKSNAQKLLKWLRTWFSIHTKADEKVKAAYFGTKDPEGKTFKAVLLSGPPGIGKTTTAHLCCKELGYDYFELNASDTRNKRGLHDVLSDALTSEALTGFTEKSRRHILIMDEVDGMSGNEDRGGVQELIALIKTSRVPIICICNDRMHPKIRSLANYCFDLRFNKPTNEQLKAMVQSLCFKEKMKLPVDSVQQLITSSDHDVRQILHQLQLIKESTTPSDTLYNPHKDLRLGPWDVCRKVFSESEHRGMSFQDKSSLFFQDYNIGPLFVHENYLKWQPTKARNNKNLHLERLKSAAESIATGDLVESIIRRSNNWSLLPTQSVFSSVLPGEFMEGNEVTGIAFPAWLGQNSHRGKTSRLLQQLHNHMHLQVSGSLEALNMDYLPYVYRSIVKPLVKEEVEAPVQMMHDYNLVREDLDNIAEVGLWPGMTNLFERVSTKVKTAFTRGVNKEQVVPYSVVKITRKRRQQGEGGLEDYDEEGEEEEDEEEDDVMEKDAMIKIRTSKKKPGKSDNEPGTSKESSRSSSSKSKSGGGSGSRSRKK